MTNTNAQRDFDNLIFNHDEDIKVATAALLAADLGVSFDPSDYDLP